MLRDLIFGINNSTVYSLRILSYVLRIRRIVCCFQLFLGVLLFQEKEVPQTFSWNPQERNKKTWKYRIKFPYMKRLRNKWHKTQYLKIFLWTQNKIDITWLSWNEADQSGKACQKIQICSFSWESKDLKAYDMTKLQRWALPGNILMEGCSLEIMESLYSLIASLLMVFCFGRDGIYPWFFRGFLCPAHKMYPVRKGTRNCSFYW